MQRRGARIPALATAAALVMMVALGPGAAAQAPPRARAADAAPTLAATVGSTPTGRALPPGFVGLSLEYWAVHEYAGRNPRAVNPVLLQLIRDLNPGQSPILRIGGNSTDWTWWPVRGVIPPAAISYSLTNGWLRTTHALAADLGAKLILGVNLARGLPGLATVEARALLQGIGRRYIEALEFGNEPDLYGYGFDWYLTEFSRWRVALPGLPLVGPSFSTLSWMPDLTQFLSSERTVRTVTIHRYPLHNGTPDPADPMYPTIANLLADSASGGLAQQLAPYVAIAHARGLRFRIDEMNSVSGDGRAGVSDTFASALWALDALFNLAAVGVDGVNIHTLPGAGYRLFDFTRTARGWRAVVHPEFYGLLLFAQAFPPGARLLPVSIAPGPVKAWATSAPDGTTRVVLINKDPATPATVQLTLPQATGPAKVERLTAPSVGAGGGIALDGQSFGSSTSTGTLAGRPKPETVHPAGGRYSVSLPAGSAAMLTR